MDNKPFPECFTRDIAEHKMTIIRDNGVDRHIRFSRPDSGIFRFDLVTWPGHLCYTGDMGTYVFSRVRDMFQFFRGDRDRPYQISFSYWAEKVLGADRDGVKEFRPENFERAVKGDLRYWIQNNRHSTSPEERRELWDAVIDEVIGAEDDCKLRAAHDFTHRVNKKLTFTFNDFFEHDTDRFTYRFLWCCHALEWAIRTYDEAKRTVVDGAVSQGGVE
jgi:hypothetical protein